MKDMFTRLTLVFFMEIKIKGILLFSFLLLKYYVNDPSLFLE